MHYDREQPLTVSAHRDTSMTQRLTCRQNIGGGIRLDVVRPQLGLPGFRNNKTDAKYCRSKSDGPLLASTSNSEEVHRSVAY
jgi:hypothetical protein